MTKITDKRKQAQAKPLTFGELEVGDYFEPIDLRSGTLDGLHQKTSGSTAFFFLRPEFHTSKVGLEITVRRLDVEIVIHGEKP